VAVMDAIRQTQRLIAADHQQLETLHRNHLKVQFGVDRDTDREQLDIEALTTGINRKFKQAEADVSEFDAVYRSDLGDDGGSDAELNILRNIKICLVNEISALSRVVRESQRRYLTALEKQKAVKDRWAGGERQREVEERMSRDVEMNEYLQRGCTQEQIDSIMLNNRMVEERDAEFQGILTSIKGLHEMFQDVNTLVIEQGTMLDRIDYNMTVTHERIVKGRKELVKAAKHQEAGTFKLCVLLLVVLIIGFTIALLVKVAL
jgi:syntaxin 16